MNKVIFTRSHDYGVNTFEVHSRNVCVGYLRYSTQTDRWVFTSDLWVDLDEMKQIVREMASLDGVEVDE